MEERISLLTMRDPVNRVQLTKRLYSTVKSVLEFGPHESAIWPHLSYYPSLESVFNLRKGNKSPLYGTKQRPNLKNDGFQCTTLFSTSVRSSTGSLSRIRDTSLQVRFTGNLQTPKVSFSDLTQTTDIKVEYFRTFF